MYITLYIKSYCPSQYFEFPVEYAQSPAGEQVPVRQTSRARFRRQSSLPLTAFHDEGFAHDNPSSRNELGPLLPYTGRHKLRLERQYLVEGAVHYFPSPAGLVFDTHVAFLPRAFVPFFEVSTFGLLYSRQHAYAQTHPGASLAFHNTHVWHSLAAASKATK